MIDNSLGRDNPQHGCEPDPRPLVSATAPPKIYPLFPDRSPENASLNIRHGEFFLDFKRVRAIFHDYDRNFVNAERLYMTIAKLALEHTAHDFGLPVRHLRFSQWQGFYQPAFGLPTDQTNQVLANIYLEHFATSRHFGLDVRERAKAIAEGQKDEFVAMVGAKRTELYDTYVRLAEREFAPRNGKNEMLISLPSHVVRDHPELHALLPIKLSLKPGVEELVLAAAAEGVMQAMVSSSNREVYVPILEKFGILHHFTALIGGRDVENHKPHPEPFHTALSGINEHSSEPIRAHQVAVTGDSPGDAIAARRAEMHPIIQVGPREIPRFMARMKERMRACGVAVSGDVFLVHSLTDLSF